jgi:three-Cys-motif partner protein
MDNLNTVGEPHNDNWGGKWTQDKIEIFLKYLNAYLTIMNKYPNYKLWYFDGFAGSGQIFDEETKSFYDGIALKAIEIDKPKSFDSYYFVELDKTKAETLKQSIATKFPLKFEKCYVVSEDCNKKATDFASFLAKDSKVKRGLAILDPFGMELKWETLESFKNINCDIWILVPTGLGVNRMLKNNGDISESWIPKLESFLGLSETEIKKRFYETKTNYTLFGEEEQTKKIDKSIEKIAELYKERMNDIWKFVSKPYPMKNSRGSVMFHFIFASQVAAGVKIADDIINSKK